MDFHDYCNVRRILRLLAAQWKLPVWVVKKILQNTIDESWNKAMSDPEAKKLWDQYFPKGKPTPEQYILGLGYAHEKGEEIPHLLKE